MSRRAPPGPATGGGPRCATIGSSGRSSRRDHGVNFELAREVFDDPRAVDALDDDPDEQRWQRTGMARNGRLVFVVDTERPPRIRISRPARQMAMTRIATSAKRVLISDGWHDDNGPIAGLPDEWQPPMTEAEKHEAAMADPDCRPVPQDRPGRLVARARFIRQRLGLSDEEFAERYCIPLDTLRDWERHRAEPDATALAFLQAIEREPEAVARALEAV